MNPVSVVTINERKKQDLFPYFLILPALLLILAVLGYSVGYGTVLSFFRYNLQSVGRPFVGFDNYRTLFASERFQQSLIRSLFYVVTSVLVASAVAVTFALALSKLRRLAGPMRAIALIPYLVSPVATATIFRFLFASDAGLINMVLEAGGIGRVLFLSDPNWAMAVAIMSNVWFNSPFAIMIILAGIEGIDRELYDSAWVDGAGPLTVLFRITLPLIYPMVAVTLTWLTLVSFNMFAIVLALTGGGPRRATELLVVLMYNIGFEELDFSTGSTLMVVILAFNFAASALFLRVFRQRW